MNATGTYLSSIEAGVHLHRDPVTGLAWAEFRGHGGISCRLFVHSESSTEGSARRMAELQVHGWKPTDRIVVAPTGEGVNVDHLTYALQSSRWAPIHEAVRQACQCGGNHVEDPAFKARIEADRVRGLKERARDDRKMEQARRRKRSSRKS